LACWAFWMGGSAAASFEWNGCILLRDVWGTVDAVQASHIPIAFVHSCRWAGPSLFYGEEYDYVVHGLTIEEGNHPRAGDGCPSDPWSSECNA
jgi:hypothetical protein